MVYTFPGTWTVIFDRIRTELPNLTDFRVDLVWWALCARLSGRRYMTFDVGLLPSQWVDAANDGEIEFGDNVAMPWVDGKNDEERDDPDPSLNRARETEDGAALEALPETIRKSCQELQT